MSTLRVTEISSTGAARLNGAAEALKIKGATQNPVTFTGTAGRSAAFQTGTKAIRVVPDVACAVAIGSSSVTAVVTDTFLAANSVTLFDVDGGDYISAIATA